MLAAACLCPALPSSAHDAGYKEMSRDHILFLAVTNFMADIETVVELNLSCSYLLLIKFLNFTVTITKRSKESLHHT